jgi:hypothetical protein
VLPPALRALALLAASWRMAALPGRALGLLGRVLRRLPGWLLGRLLPGRLAGGLLWPQMDSRNPSLPSASQDPGTSGSSHSWGFSRPECCHTTGRLPGAGAATCSMSYASLPARPTNTSLEPPELYACISEQACSCAPSSGRGDAGCARCPAGLLQAASSWAPLLPPEPLGELLGLQALPLSAASQHGGSSGPGRGLDPLLDAALSGSLALRLPCRSHEAYGSADSPRGC